jgi:hypothetical protein
MEKSPAGIGTSRRDHVAVARRQAKNRCLPVSGQGQAAQASEGAQLLWKRFTCVLNRSMSARYVKILIFEGAWRAQDMHAEVSRGYAGARER